MTEYANEDKKEILITEIPKLAIIYPHMMRSEHIPDIETLRNDYYFLVDENKVVVNNVCGGHYGPVGPVAEQCKGCDYWVTRITDALRKGNVVKLENAEILKIKREFDSYIEELLEEGTKLSEVYDNIDLGNSRFREGVKNLMKGWSKRNLIQERGAYIYSEKKKGDVVSFAPIGKSKYGKPEDLELVLISYPSKSSEREKSKGRTGRLVFEAGVVKGDSVYPIISQEREQPHLVYVRIAEVLEDLQSLIIQA